MSKHPQGYCPAFGNYPKEYKPAVHGPYYPWVNYGPRDTPLSQVKLGELTDWLRRRNKTPQAMVAAISRLIHTYHFKWTHVKFSKPSQIVLHAYAFISLGSMLLSYGHYRSYRSHKYRW